MAKKKTDEAGEGTEEIGFEKALARLETIVEEMESGALSLEDMMKRFEEGQTLVKGCAGKLNQVERRIELLVKEGEKVSTEPFADRTTPSEEAADVPGNGLPF